MNRAAGICQGSCHAPSAWTRLRFPDTLGLLRRDWSGYIGRILSRLQGATGCYIHDGPTEICAENAKKPAFKPGGRRLEVPLRLLWRPSVSDCLSLLSHAFLLQGSHESLPTAAHDGDPRQNSGSRASRPQQFITFAWVMG